jgi:hypothetical protein
VEVVLFNGSNVLGHCQHRIREEIDRDDTLTPDPAVVDVWINAGSSVHSILNGTLLNRLKVSEQLLLP